ncbi:unnamed protein product [Amoebophrya sp. A120]|nr:unnamed protein product [Amoebophrya sp. A120]|eukprot:GSA120T00013704001.1
MPAPSWFSSAVPSFFAPSNRQLQQQQHLQQQNHNNLPQPEYFTPGRKLPPPVPLTNEEVFVLVTTTLVLTYLFVCVCDLCWFVGRKVFRICLLLCDSGTRVVCWLFCRSRRGRNRAENQNTNSLLFEIADEFEFHEILEEQDLRLAQAVIASAGGKIELEMLSEEINIVPAVVEVDHGVEMEEDEEDDNDTELRRTTSVEQNGSSNGEENEDAHNEDEDQVEILDEEIYVHHDGGPQRYEEREQLPSVSEGRVRVVSAAQRDELLHDQEYLHADQSSRRQQHLAEQLTRENWEEKILPELEQNLQQFQLRVAAASDCVMLVEQVVAEKDYEQPLTPSTIEGSPLSPSTIEYESCSGGVVLHPQSSTKTRSSGFSSTATTPLTTNFGPPSTSSSYSSSSATPLLNILSATSSACSNYLFRDMSGDQRGVETTSTSASATETPRGAAAAELKEKQPIFLRNENKKAVEGTKELLRRKLLGNKRRKSLRNSTSSSRSVASSKVVRRSSSRNSPVVQSRRSSIASTASSSKNTSAGTENVENLAALRARPWLRS